VFTSESLDMKLLLSGLQKGVQSTDEREHLFTPCSFLSLFESTIADTFCEKGRDVEPAWIGLHLGRGIELKNLIYCVEMQSCEGFGTTLEEAWRLPADYAIQACEALLSVEENSADPHVHLTAS